MRMRSLLNVPVYSIRKKDLGLELQDSFLV